MRHQLRWAGHCVRMEDTRLPKQVFYSQLCHSKRSQGGQRKRFKDILKVYLKRGDTDPANRETLAVDRSEWRLTVYQAVVHFETNRLKQEAERRIRRKERAQHPGQITPSETNICHICGRVCRARIGLISHLRTHSVPLLCFCSHSCVFVSPW